MRDFLVWLVLTFLVVALFGTVVVSDAKAGTQMSGAVASGVAHQSLVQPVIVWRDCQRIARCYGCRPVFHCRTCTYQRQCLRRGPCQWGDVCVWGPFLPVAPRGVRVY